MMKCIVRQQIVCNVVGLYVNMLQSGHKMLQAQMHIHKYILKK